MFSNICSTLNFDSARVHWITCRLAPWWEIVQGMKWIKRWKRANGVWE